jgi:ubiquinone/menaquinone biosynthesis C-methylase UbiE
MPLDEAPYALKGGREGYDRLLLLAKKSWPATAGFLGRAGMSPGMRVVDVGCGGGAVSLEIAEMVGPSGSVVGLDLNSTFLKLARQAAGARALTNIEFREQRVETWNEPDAFDAAYSRFLMEHLRDPVGLIGRMWSAIRPGGLLVVEDADHSTWFCDPPDESFDFFRETLGQVIDQRGGDHTFGRRLYHACRSAGVVDPTLSVVTPFCIRGEEKLVAWTTLDAVADSAVEARVRSRSELDHALASLRKFSEREDSLIVGPLRYQAFARKPGTG